MHRQLNRFKLLVYRMPTKPTAGRVAVWRQLKKIGSIYLQQSVCVFPDSASLRRELAPILQRIEEAGGEFHLLPLRTLDEDEEHKLINRFVEQASSHYREIVENCEVNFTKEIEFETYRKNFTYEEAEEIRNEFDKICAWFERVRQRDWFSAPNEPEARAWLRRCEQMLEEFEAKVYDAQDEGSSQDPDTQPAKRRRPRLTTSPRAGTVSGVRPKSVASNGRQLSRRV
jgi:hypothetical protein